MKFLLVFVVVLVIAWRWRSWRESGRLTKKNSEPTNASASEMVRCRQCGLHIPANEATVGTLGSYCSTDHQRQLEP